MLFQTLDKKNVLPGGTSLLLHIGDYSPWVSDHCSLLFEIKILVNQQEPTLPQDFQDNGPLDYLITEEELKKASYILNKSSGYDCVSNEMIIGMLEVKPALG